MACNDRDQYRAGSAAADGDDDFDLIAVSQRLCAEPAARHDFAVAFERDALAGEIQALEQLPAIERLLKAVRRAVYGDYYHTIGFNPCGYGILAVCRVFGNLRQNWPARDQKLSRALSPNR